MICFAARTIFDSSFWGICTEKQQREHFKETARLSCCSDNCGVIGNHLCKLQCPLNEACRKYGYSFSRPIFFFFLLQNNPTVFLFRAIEEVIIYRSGTRETLLLILGLHEFLPASSLSGRGLHFLPFKAGISPCGS